MNALKRDWLLDQNPASRGQARLGQFYLGWLKLIRNPLAVIGVIIIALLVFMAAFAPLVATHDPIAQNLANRLQPPFSDGHLLGTDEFGRDIFGLSDEPGCLAMTVRFSFQHLGGLHDLN